MIPFEKIRTTVVKGLKGYLGCPVIGSDQTGETPKYPYITFKVTTDMSENNGTYGEYEDGKARKPVKHIWSVSAVSDDEIEAITYACKAREWLDYVATITLYDNDIVVQEITSVTNRDNFLSVGYQYKRGFDCTFSCMDEITSKYETVEPIETVTFDEDIRV